MAADSSRKKIHWHAGWQSRLFHAVLTPFYLLFKAVFKRQVIMIVCMMKDDRDREVSRFRNTYDYVRCRTMGLAAELVKEGRVEGAVAEAGVFRGEFARRVSAELPDRDIYLYDTFGGFSPEQVQHDLAKGLTSSSIIDSVGNFQDTNVEEVLNNMPDRSRCRVRKGFFPDSVEAEDRDLKFAFVSLDLDLYEPILEGLRFFYPRLSPGGYIFVHDYNSPILEGVRLAVEEFEKENGLVCKTPLPDAAGTLIITKR